MTTTDPRAKAIADADHEAAMRLLARAGTYADDAWKMRDDPQVRAALGEQADGFALLYEMVRDELRRVAGRADTAPRVRHDDHVVCRLSPDATLVLDAAPCIVLATPERRVTIGNVAAWREALATAKVEQAVATGETVP